MSDVQSFVAGDGDFEAVVKAYQPAEIPATLYHYTDAAGLWGIITSNTLWLTHFRYTNDASEVTYGIQRAIAHIEKVIEASNDSTEYHLEDALRGDVPGVKPSDVLLQAALATLRTPQIEVGSRYQYYFACLTEHADQLGQWRAYSKDASGFSIGFSREVLRNRTLIEQLQNDKLGDTVDLLKVIYDERVQASILDDVLNSARQHADTVMPTLPMDIRKEYITTANAWVIISILRLALHFKHQGFQEEAEWRLILCKTDPDKAEKETSNQIKTRVTELGITPYVASPLCGLDELLRLEKVTIGPKRDPYSPRSDSPFGLKVLFKQLYGGAPVQGLAWSETPYR